MSFLITKHEPIILVVICLDNYSINERDCKCCLEIYLFNELKAAILDCSLTVLKLNNKNSKTSKQSDNPGNRPSISEGHFHFPQPPRH